MSETQKTLDDLATYLKWLEDQCSGSIHQIPEVLEHAQNLRKYQDALKDAKIQLVEKAKLEGRVQQLGEQLSSTDSVLLRAWKVIHRHGVLVEPGDTLPVVLERVLTDNPRTRGEDACEQ